MPDDETLEDRAEELVMDHYLSGEYRADFSPEDAISDVTALLREVREEALEDAAQTLLDLIREQHPGWDGSEEYREYVREAADAIRDLKEADGDA